MSGFWKFNSLINLIGCALLVAAFFVAEHSIYPYKVTGTELPAYLISVSTNNRTAYLAVVGASLMGWQAAMTVLMMVVGFFQPYRGGVKK